MRVATDNSAQLGESIHPGANPMSRRTLALYPDHVEIIALAVADVRALYAATPDPDRLLGGEFTLRDLRLAHEAIAGESLQRDTFRRAMEPHLEATGHRAAIGRGRPAELFRRR